MRALTPVTVARRVHEVRCMQRPSGRAGSTKLVNANRGHPALGCLHEYECRETGRLRQLLQDRLLSQHGNPEPSFAPCHTVELADREQQREGGPSNSKIPAEGEVVQFPGQLSWEAECLRRLDYSETGYLQFSRQLLRLEPLTNVIPVMPPPEALQEPLLF